MKQHFQGSHKFKINARDVAELKAKFGDVGLKLPNDISRRQRVRDHKDEEEIYLVRRYTFTLATNKEISFPFFMEKSESPDFWCESDQLKYGIEVTQATSQEDQREMTLASEASVPVLLGSLGGRKAAENGHRAIVEDILKAIERKIPKINTTYRNFQHLELLIYVNSNVHFFYELKAVESLLKVELDKRKILTANLRKIGVILGKVLLQYERHSFKTLDLVENLSLKDEL